MTLAGVCDHVRSAEPRHRRRPPATATSFLFEIFSFLLGDHRSSSWAQCIAVLAISLSTAQLLPQKTYSYATLSRSHRKPSWAPSVPVNGMAHRFIHRPSYSSGFSRSSKNTARTTRAKPCGLHAPLRCSRPRLGARWHTSLCLCQPYACGGACVIPSPRRKGGRDQSVIDVE